MTIHHTLIKKAERMGVILSEQGNSVGFQIPQFNITGNASSAKLALQMADEKIKARRQAEYEEAQSPTPFDAPSADVGSSETPTTPSGANTSLIERINGVAIDGAVAYSEGTSAADCPYSSENEDAYDDFIRWNEEWDAAADAETEDKGGGSVVSDKFRAKYAEMGHPTHCGDQLAEVLNELVLNKGGTNIELFEEICNLNGVSLAKYKHEGKGWEGRLRMTGRNLLAKKVYLNEGVLKLPQTISGGQFQMSAEWMAAQRFKKMSP